MPDMLVESPVAWLDPSTLIESADGSGSPSTIEGQFSAYDVKNKNGRVYPRRLWESLVREGESADRLNHRQLIGFLDHPPSPTGRIRESAILTTQLELRDDGIVYGKADILPTPDGKTLVALLQAGVRVGISSRGTGTVGSEGEVANDFQLYGFDIVTDPSTHNAYPKLADDKSKKNESTDNTTPSPTIEEAQPASSAVISEDTMNNSEVLENLDSRLDDVQEQLDGLTESTIPKATIKQIKRDLNQVSSRASSIGSKDDENRANAEALQERVKLIRHRLNEQSSIKKATGLDQPSDPPGVQPQRDTEPSVGQPTNSGNSDAGGLVQLEKYEAAKAQSEAYYRLFRECFKDLRSALSSLSETATLHAEAEARADQATADLQVEKRKYAALQRLGQLALDEQDNLDLRAAVAEAMKNPKMATLASVVERCETVAEVHSLVESVTGSKLVVSPDLPDPSQSHSSTPPKTVQEENHVETPAAAGDVSVQGDKPKRKRNLVSEITMSALQG